MPSDTPVDAAASVIDSVVATNDDELVELRRDLHAHPELSWAETRTGDLVAAAVEKAGWRVTRLPQTGLVADLGDSGPVGGSVRMPSQPGEEVVPDFVRHMVSFWFRSDIRGIFFVHCDPGVDLG